MKTEDAVRALAAYTKEEVSRLETRLQQLQDTHCEEKIAGLETDVASLRSRKGVDDKQVSEELQKRVHDIEQTLTTLAVYIKEETSSQAESKVGERIDALEDHIDELDAEELSREPLGKLTPHSEIVKKYAKKNL